MSEATPKMMDRFLALPRAIQWALLAAVGIAIFFGREAYIVPFENRLDKQSNEIQVHVDSIRRNTQLVESLKTRTMESLVTAVGEVKEPRSAAIGTRAFTDVVNDLMKKNGISDQDFSLRTRGKLPKNVLVQVLNGKRGERLTGELKFSAKPEVALAILADLESSPDIEQVASVRLTKDAAGKVKVQYTLEAWVISSETAGGPGASTAL